LIEPRLIEQEMSESYLNYALSVIHSRALPDVRDGLKPSQRRILVAMNDLKLRPNAKYRKCANIAGVTGPLHRAGDSPGPALLGARLPGPGCRGKREGSQGTSRALEEGTAGL